MTTSLETLLGDLSKQIGDYWASAATSGGSSTIIVDTALKAKANDWISDAPQEMYDRITSLTYDEEERKISSLDNSDGTLTTLAHGGTIATATTYEIHRMFSASEKRRALVYAARQGFPYIFERIIDDSKTVGNWLRNGCVEIWTVSTWPASFAVSALTCAKNTTAPYFSRGLSSAKLTGSAGYLYQSTTEVSELIELAGQSLTFTAEVWSDTASDTRLSIYDGTTTTYSSYHTGGDTREKLTVSATIATSPSQVRFAIHRGASSTAYTDDWRVYGPIRDKVYIGDIGLAQDKPHRVSQAADAAIHNEPWHLLHKYRVQDGWLYLHEGSANCRLRLEGIGYLNFLVSGAVSTAWAAVIDINSPQTEILVAEAIMYLYTQMILPNFTSGDRESFVEILNYWASELNRRRAKFGMPAPLPSVIW